MAAPLWLWLPNGFSSKINKYKSKSLPPWLGLPSGRRYPRQSSIPQGGDDLFIQDGMALLHTSTNLPPTCCEICIQILDQTAIPTHSYHPGSIKAQERLRRSSPEIILAGSAVRQPYYFKSFHSVWSGEQAWLPGWTEQLWQSSLWRVEFINLLQQIAR